MSATILIQIVLSTFAVSAVALVGIVLLYKNSILSSSLSKILVGFAAGTLLGTAFVFIVPEAFELSGDIETISLFILFGVLFGFVMERFLHWHHHHHEDTHGVKPTASLIIFGDILHSFVDGLAVAAGFLVSPAVGIATTLSIIAHEVPQEIADFSILIHSGIEKKKALFYNFISGTGAIVGGVLGYFAFESFESVIPFILALTGGLFIYIAASDLIPEIHVDHNDRNKIRQVLPLFLGIVLMVGVSYILPHSHAHEDDHSDEVHIDTDQHEEIEEL